MAFDFDTVVSRKNTFAAKYDLAAARNKPLDAISLWVADMDFPTAPCITEVLKERAEHGIFGYSRPDSRYYDAVKTWFKNRHNFTIESEWILNVPGVVYAIAAAIRTFTKEGDAVLIQRPVYYPFSNTINANNRRLVNNALVFKNGHYEIDFEDFEKKIIEENVKLFVFCSPHNPGGRVWTKDELNKISNICLKHNVIVVSDEIHSDITFDNHTHTVYGTLSEQALQNSIICTSPSKTFNLAGLQFSNIIIANPKIREEFQKEIDRTGYDEPSLMGLAAATVAYSKGAEWFDEAKKYIWNNVLFTEKYFSEHCPKIRVIKPEGSYLVWLDFSAFTNLSDTEISKKVLRDAKVWLDYGKMFGPEGEKFQRINVATPRTILQKALEQISKEFKDV
ncbi:MalY/PatB family protein [Treponema sp.]|uniref:MalY/PatB family protein n=1 Tax=Treponema sp. TaxID=166 RepID=UPI00298EA810|nr:MalY/PatB family protein [Treponema sp.]MCR5614169.1 pyridoxal phosphate-dependent aminotransferase [Treponema sp.]